MRALPHLRTAAGLLAAAVLAGVALWPEATPVDTGAVTRGPMQVTIDEDGVTRVRERFVVAAPVSGRLQRIEWEPGDTVHRGTVLARLAPADAPLIDARVLGELRAAVEAADAAATQAAADRERAGTALERARLVQRQQEALVKAGATAPDSVDAARAATRTAEAAVHAADAAVDRAAHEVQLARARLQGPAAAPGRLVTVTAPIDGVVLHRLRESEAVVGAGEPLIELGNGGDLEIVADLLSSDAVRASVGAPAWIEDWGGAERRQGTVRRIEPAGFTKVSALGVEEQRVNVVIALTGDAAARLGDGYRARVRIVAWSADAVVQAPIGSLFRRGEDWAVFVVDQGHARQRTVRIDHRNNDVAEVIGGLMPADRVVLHPPDTLRDGSRIRQLP